MKHGQMCILQYFQGLKYISLMQFSPSSSKPKQMETNKIIFIYTNKNDNKPTGFNSTISLQNCHFWLWIMIQCSVCSSLTRNMYIHKHYTTITILYNIKKFAL